MKSYRKELWFNTPHRRDYINITDTVETLVRDDHVAPSGEDDGLHPVSAREPNAFDYRIVGHAGGEKPRLSAESDCGETRERNMFTHPWRRIVDHVFAALFGCGGMKPRFVSKRESYKTMLKVLSRSVPPDG